MLGVAWEPDSSLLHPASIIFYLSYVISAHLSPENNVFSSFSFFLYIMFLQKKIWYREKKIWLLFAVML